MSDENAQVDLEMKVKEDEEEYDDLSDLDSIKAEQRAQKKPRGFFSTFLSSLATGQKELTSDMMQPIIQQLEAQLKSKNVNSEVAQDICKSVLASLEGKNVSTFTSVANTVKQTMEETLTRILTPKRRIDVLRDINEARKQQRPYSIVMVGVNGVGKSTSLSKLCYWIKQQGLRVMIAACDTFRSGAVEQLKVHSKCLQIPLYQKGYGKEPAQVAKDALAQARQENMDVVMIDTAGRMQDNEPLMAALARLIQVNTPDLVLFVGEALVGNDGVDQLVKFNNSLKRLAAKGSASSVLAQKDNLIDGVFLTKFDTIDDKVGASISMVYSTGIPVLFVGVGQQYVDLKSLSVKAIVKTLLE